MNPAYGPPSDAWPDKGAVRMSHLTLRYPSAATCVRLCICRRQFHQPDTHAVQQSTDRPVIKDLSFSIPPGTRVGVVGRTGQSMGQE